MITVNSVNGVKRVALSDSSLIAAHSGTPIKVSAPLGLGVTVIGSREATLIWDAPIQRNGNILNYHLYYKEEGSDRCVHISFLILI